MREWYTTNPTVLALGLFFGGFVIQMVIDHFLRIQDDEVQTGGIPETLWFVVTSILVIPSAILAWKGTKSLGGVPTRLFVFSFELIFGFVLYSMIAFWYVVITGIDSL